MNRIKTFIVAEAGSNHNNNLNTAKRLIKVAKDVGADAIKFQLFSGTKLYSKKDKRSRLMKKFELKSSWVKELVRYSKKNKIFFFASPFDNDSVDILIKNKVKIIKIASPEIRDDLLIEHIAKKKVFTIISTGVSTIKEILNAKKIINKYHNNLAILQCSSIYPCDANNLNLNIIKEYKKLFPKNIIGFSDHSLNTISPVVAVALGARIIEKHFTLSNKQNGPDHKISIEPNKFADMVKSIRIAENSFGKSKKKILKKESLKNHTKTFFTKKFIKKGSRLSEKNIELLRSSIGIKNSFLRKVIGKTTRQDLKDGELIKWKFLK